MHRAPKLKNWLDGGQQLRIGSCLYGALCAWNSPPGYPLGCSRWNWMALDDGELVSVVLLRRFHLTSSVGIGLSFD